MSREPDEDGFLSRWSRRKIEGQADAADDAPGAVGKTETGPDAAPDEPPEARTDDEILAGLDLPHPETLGPGDDFSVYLKAPLPDHLRVMALRRLWRSNPVFAHLDGLNEYDGDFTKGGVSMGALKTAYQVGKGFLKEAVAPDEAGPSEPKGTPDAEGGDGPEVIAHAESAEADLEGAGTSGAPDPAPPEDHTDAMDGPTHRRMAFRFGDPD